MYFNGDCHLLQATAYDSAEVVIKNGCIKLTSARDIDSSSRSHKETSRLAQNKNTGINDARKRSFTLMDIPTMLSTHDAKHVERLLFWEIVLRDFDHDTHVGNNPQRPSRQFHRARPSRKCPPAAAALDQTIAVSLRAVAW